MLKGRLIHFGCLFNLRLPGGDCIGIGWLLLFHHHEVDLLAGGTVGMAVRQRHGKHVLPGLEVCGIQGGVIRRQRASRSSPDAASQAFSSSGGATWLREALRCHSPVRQDCRSNGQDQDNAHVITLLREYEG